MADHLELLSLSHVNAIVDGYQRSVDHLRDVLGMQMNMEIPARDGDDTDACLMSLGDVIFEFFAPRARSERGQGRLLDRYGEHYLGAEFRVPDVDVARSYCQREGIRIIRDEPGFFFTYPGQCCGISWEIFDGNWHEPPHGGREGDEVTNPAWTPVHSAAHWRDEHPLGIVGLARLGVAVPDLREGLQTFQRVTGGTIVDRPSRPGGAAVDVQVGDTVFELLAPAGAGSLSTWLDRYGQRIRSTVFRVQDLGRAADHLATKGIELVPGDAPGAWAIPPEQNLDLLFELTE